MHSGQSLRSCQRHIIAFGSPAAWHLSVRTARLRYAQAARVASPVLRKCQSERYAQKDITALRRLSGSAGPSSAVVSGTLPAGRRLARMAGSPTPLLSSTPSSVASVSWQGGYAMPSIHASARSRIVLDGYLRQLRHTPATATRFAFT